MRSLPGDPPPALRFTAADALILALVVAAFSWIAFRNIRQPGLYGDEAWMGVSAARCVWGEAPAGSLWKIRLFGHTLPTMLNSYVGPVKGYMLTPAFAAFGVSVPVLRSATATVGLLGVVVFYFLARQQFGRAAAAASALLLATDLSFVLAVRCDWGPVDFAFLARVAAILLLLSWQRRRERRALLLLAALLLGLGVSFKLDFLGTVAAVAVAAAVFFRGPLRPRARETALAAGAFLLASFPMLLYNIVTRGNTFRTGVEMSGAAPRGSFVSALLQRLQMLENLLGGGIGAFFLGERFQKASAFGGSLLPAAVFLLPLLLCLPFTVRALAPWRRPLGFFLTVFFVLLLLIAAVPIATGPHHVISLYPFPQLFLGAGLAGLWLAAAGAPRALRWFTRFAAAAILAILLASNLLLAETFHRRLAARGGDRYWSESIYDLSSVLLKDYRGETVELLDWGFEQPLILLGRDALKLDPVFWRILADPAPETWLAPLVRQPGRVFVRRSPRFAFDKRVHDRFDAAVRSNPGLVMEEKTFFQKNGEPSFSILRLRPTSPPFEN